MRVQKLQRRHQCVLLRVVASVRRREAAWSRRHTQLQSELQVPPPVTAESAQNLVSPETFHRGTEHLLLTLDADAAL